MYKKYALVIAECRVELANILRVSHILPTYFTSLQSSEITLVTAQCQVFHNSHFSTIHILQVKFLQDSL